MKNIFEIALPIPKDILFSYSIPDELIEDRLIGRRVLVPFGKRTITGIIVATGKSVKDYKIKSIYEILDTQPVFSDAMLKLTKWISIYYLCSWGDVLKAALPQGMSPKSVLHIKKKFQLSDLELYELSWKSPKRAALLKVINEIETPISIGALEKQYGFKALNVQLEALENMNLIECERVMEKGSKAKFVKSIRLSIELQKDKEKLKVLVDSLNRKAVKQALLLSKLFINAEAKKEDLLVSQITKEFKIPHSTINTLCEKGYVEITEIEIDRSLNINDGESLSTRDESKLILTEQQQTALDKILLAIDCMKSKPFLLHGVTGSGKTLIYLHAIRKVISDNKTALILVPEISLTPQLIDRFDRVFPGEIAVLHSRMSQGEKYDSWKSISKGKKKIVLGVRSAVFAPLENVGLIIVDEEHEPSYKQDSQTPRYNARDAAIVRGQFEGAVVLLGSATPSIESHFNANVGKYELLKIDNRADGAELPEMKVVDLIYARRKGQMSGAFSFELIEAIKDRLSKKEGIILFINRRGFSPMLECPDCGYIPECNNCSVSLTYHKKIDRLNCHYCGASHKIHRACPACGYPELKEIGFGTQRIEGELNKILKQDNIQVVIQRMDLDTTSKKGAHRRILLDFAKGDTDILIGTQMVAKGLDFERVTLIGVINADLQLFLPDFRASERTFQLLTQVAGRAGRTKSKPGEVIIQTSHPSDAAIKFTVMASYDKFFDDEIAHRQKAFYPPFSRFTVIEFSGKDRDKVKKQANYFAALLPKKSKYIRVFGPMDPSISKIRGDYRKVILIKNDKTLDTNALALRKFLNYSMTVYNKKFSTLSVKLKIDIDAFSQI